MHRVVNRITLRRPFLSRFVTTPTSSVVPVAKPSPAAESNVTKESTTPPPKKEMIWALKKEKGHGLSSEDSDADAGFEVLALMHKSNVRFTLKHFRDVDQPKTEAEAEDDEKHLAPQHRRFLIHPKVGAGTPLQREKVNNSMKLDRAAASAHKYQMVKLGFVDQEAGSNDLTKHKGIDSAIEDKIQLAILQGDFDNLSNHGKKLETYQNPLVDRTTDLAYEILRKNGIKPEWIELQQNMNSLKDDLRARLRSEWAHYCLDYNQRRNHERKDANTAVEFVMPFQHSDFAQTAMVKYEFDEKVCNVKVDAYNLNVPSHVLTRGRVMLEFEIDRICKENQFTSLTDAEAMYFESRRQAQNLEHFRYAVQAEMMNRVSEGNKSSGPSTASKGPGFLHQRTVHDPSAMHGGQSGYGTGAYYRDRLPGRSNSPASGGDLVMRSLMVPVEILASRLMKAMQRFSF